MGDIKKDASTETLLAHIVEGIRNVKGKDILTIDLSGLENRVCNYFTICHGDSNTHVSAIAESVVKEVRENFKWSLLHKEGQDNACWVLLDYGSVVVHVFQKESRDFYHLEELWADGEVVALD